MKKNLKLFLSYIFFISLFFTVNVFSDTPHFIDFSKVLNESNAGKEAQLILKNKLKNSVDKFNNEQKNLREEEKKIINERKNLKVENYQKKVQALRIKVSNMQKEKQITFQKIAKLRSESKEKLLVALKPLIKNYMEKNNIKLVIDKKTVLLGDKNLEITNQIIDTLNKELKSLNIK